MAKKIYLDPGHGGKDPGATANDIHEADIVLKIALRVRRILLDEYSGVSVRLSRTTDVFKTLSWRADDANAWGADYFISIHCNSGGGNGFESYRYSGLDSITKLQREVHDAVFARADRQASWLVDRGKKSANFAVLRETAMQAVLTENLFVDHDDSAKLLKKDSFLDELARGHAVGIARAAGLTKTGGGEDDMALTDDDIDRIASAVWNKRITKVDDPTKKTLAQSMLRWMHALNKRDYYRGKDVEGKVDALIVAFREHDASLAARIDAALADATVQVDVHVPHDDVPDTEPPEEQ